MHKSTKPSLPQISGAFVETDTSSGEYPVSDSQVLYLNAISTSSYTV
jgi:hypothetical protein